MFSFGTEILGGGVNKIHPLKSNSYRKWTSLKVGIQILNTISKFAIDKNETKKGPLKFQKDQNSYREYSNENVIENRPPQKWAFWNLELKLITIGRRARGPKAPAGPEGPPAHRRC